VLTIVFLLLFAYLAVIVLSAIAGWRRGIRNARNGKLPDDSREQARKRSAERAAGQANRAAEKRIRDM
jgi:hypothetical protein